MRRISIAIEMFWPLTKAWKLFALTRSIAFEGFDSLIQTDEIKKFAPSARASVSRVSSEI